MSIEIRKAGQPDAHLLFSISRETYSHYFASYWNKGGLEWYLNEVYSLDKIKVELSGDQIIYFLVFDNGSAIGFMKINLSSIVPGHTGQYSMEIEKIYLHEGYLGKGIGKKLVNIAIAQAKKNQILLIWLGVLDTNHQAIEFYKNMGFEFHDKIRLTLPYFKDSLRGLCIMTMHV